jgi:hypothetical protein
MSFQPNPLQTLILWRLLMSEGQAYLADIRPKLKQHDRKALLEAGFIEEKWCRNLRNSRAIYVYLTDKAWAWIGDHMDATFSHQSPAAGPIFQSFLAKLQPILKSRRITLAEILGSTKEALPSKNLEQRLREAYFHLSGGAGNVRIRLAQLRQKLEDIPRHELDELLLKLQREEKLVLSPLDDTQEISPADQQAALNVAGFKRHIIYMQNRTNGPT